MSLTKRHGRAAASVARHGYPGRVSDQVFDISTDPSRLDLDRVHGWLSTDTYWARGCDRAAVDRAAANSITFGVYAPNGTQVGYARAVTDLTTFAWVADVYIDRSVRGRGLGVRLTEAIRDHLSPYGLRRIVLMTADAHEVYAKVGFTALPDPGRFMMLCP